MAVKDATLTHPAFNHDGSIEKIRPGNERSLVSPDEDGLPPSPS
jgi:hypothetical protein